MKAYETGAYGDFLLGAFRNPKGVSALTPSSPSLARAIANEVDAGREGLVVELGPGTGAVTAALLARGIAPKSLLLVECEPQFVLVLRRLYPALDVRCGDALRLDDYLAPSTRVAAVVSGLPILHLPPEIRRRLVRQSLACQDAGGLFIQLSYGWQSPVPAEAGVTVAKRTVWSNFPPAHIWTYRSQS
jgi:phosphatidylethanolamine/phosphatidyl-N-methylethanolamine N-methyltransferase